MGNKSIATICVRPLSVSVTYWLQPPGAAPRSMYLAELALDLCKDRLKGGGDFICKLFQGEGTDAFIVGARAVFDRVRVMKPKASRAGSREVYLVARNYQL